MLEILVLSEYLIWNFWGVFYGGIEERNVVVGVVVNMIEEVIEN